MSALQPMMTDATFAQDPLAWLGQKASQHKLKYLLAYDVDGVMWGLWDGKAFTFSQQAFPHELEAIPIRPATLQQVRLFDEAGEVLVWRTNEGFAFREILKGKEPSERSMEECYWLWGTGLLSGDGFSLLNEGEQGLRHAPPFEGVKETQRLGLKVRHYIDENANGWQRISASRLVGLEIVEGGGK